MKGCLRNVVAFGTQAPAAGYQAAFTTTMGKSWAKFVCDFETHHGIPNTVACAKAAAGPGDVSQTLTLSLTLTL